MARDITGALDDVLNSGVVQPLLAAELIAPSGPLRLFAGIGTLSFGGKTFKGSELLRVDRIREQVATRKQGASFGFAGVDPEIIAMVDNERLEDSPITVWFGALDANLQPVPDPAVVGGYKVDVPETIDDTTSVTLTVSTYALFEDLNKAPELVWDDESHQAAHLMDVGDCDEARLSQLSYSDAA